MNNGISTMDTVNGVVPHVPFVKKWTNPCLFLSIFVLFSLQFQYNLKKA